MSLLPKYELHFSLKRVDAVLGQLHHLSRYAPSATITQQLTPKSYTVHNVALHHQVQQQDSAVQYKIAQRRAILLGTLYTQTA